MCLAGVLARRQLASLSSANHPATCSQQISSLATGETTKDVQEMLKQDADIPQACRASKPNLEL